MNLRFHNDVDDPTLVHGTYWGDPNGSAPYRLGSAQTRRVACDSTPILVMAGIFDVTEDMITCLECIAKMR